MKEVAGIGGDERKRFNLYTALIYACRIIYNRAKQISPITINNERFTLALDKNHEEHLFTGSMQRIEQVFIILNNALDELATSPKSFEERYIHISVISMKKEIKIYFRDNTGGIPEKLLPTLFDPFVSTKSQSGMGIGLNIAKTIVEDHDGTIIAYNDPQGAVFEITLPLDQGGK